MVAIFEVVFLVLMAILGLRWLRRTSLYRGRRRSPRALGQHSYGWGTHGMYTHVDPPNEQSHRE